MQIILKLKSRPNYGCDNKKFREVNSSLTEIQSEINTDGKLLLF